LYIPSKNFLTKGVVRHKDYLSFFELALRSAGIEFCNLVAVSSIFPPSCKRISREEGLKEIKPGGTFIIGLVDKDVRLEKPMRT